MKQVRKTMLVLCSGCLAMGAGQALAAPHNSPYSDHLTGLNPALYYQFDELGASGAQGGVFSPTIGDGNLSSTGGGQGAWINPGFPIAGITSGANGAASIRSTSNVSDFTHGDMDRHLNIVADPIFSGNENAIVDNLDIGIIKANWNKSVRGAAGRDLPNAGYFFDPDEGTIGDEIPQGDACARFFIGFECGVGKGDGHVGQVDLNQALRDFGRKTPGKGPTQMYHIVQGCCNFSQFAPTDAPGNPLPVSGVALVRDLGETVQNNPTVDGAGDPTYSCNCYNLDRVIMGIGWSNASANGSNSAIGDPANEINTTNFPGLGRVSESGWRFYIRDADAAAGNTQNFGNGVITAPAGGPGVLAMQFVGYGTDFSVSRIEVEAPLGTAQDPLKYNVLSPTPNLGDGFPRPEDDGGWHLVGFTYDGSGTAAGIKLFLDGVELPTTSTHDDTFASATHSILPGLAFGSPFFNPSGMTVGNAFGRIDAWDGLLDEWAYFNRELTVQDMIDLYSLATTGALPVSPVPEPASLALVALGGLALLTRRR